jgi:thiamine biosynthesis lipoprotein
MSRKVLLTILALVTIGLAAGCILQSRSAKTAQEEQSCTRQLFAMDTVMSFTAYGKNCEEAVDAAMKEVQRLDALLSTGIETSEISQINESGGGELSDDTEAILTRAMEIYDSTDGLFDFTIYPVMELWGFTDQQYHVPTEEELQDALSLVDASKVRTDGNEVTLGDGQQLDFGGIAKGYTSGVVMDVFREYGITSGMVSLGGNVQVLNRKTDGTCWKIGIQDPASETGSVLAAVELENCAVITSGGYQRYFEQDGNTYIHIIDPRTGYPVEGDLTSVTIISEDGTMADALSTSLYIMGLDRAIAYWQSEGESFDMVLVTVEGELYVTEGISERLTTEKEVIVVNQEKQ